MRADFRLAVLTLLCGSALLGVLPFVWFRFSQGQSAAGIVDLGISVVLLGVIVHAWRGGNIDTASRACVLATAAGCIAVTWLAGMAGVLWTYPLVLGTCVLLGRGLAIALASVSIAAIATVAVHTGVLLPGSPVVMFVATSVLAGVLSLLFAERARMQHAKLEDLAARDALTGALNRRAMNRELQLAVEANQRHATAFGLAILDIDHFKRVNDSHGHEAGDQVLVDLVALLQGAVRKLDQVYRMGGEEFVVLFTAVDAPALPGLCEGLRARIEAQLHGGDDPITVSIGCAMLQRGEDSGSWLARADAALYRAKRAGRNRVEQATAGAPAQPA
ncbi:diguanylate cyclase [Luteimonas sp. 50]|uniref:diguanylate cyclase n=1 Tax=Cognatiluteimonas sedimenti TaxID=2927791 RepID=A0ABT0A2Q4_9GAMM|nr:GGDEF domain-containing protein [Lysobacter sedimenti]MCJ0825258.1 diguanylate cyclase [Lysobacter sedimenti]